MPGVTLVVEHNVGAHAALPRLVQNWALHGKKNARYGQLVLTFKATHVQPRPIFILLCFEMGNDEMKVFASLLAGPPKEEFTRLHSVVGYKLT